MTVYTAILNERIIHLMHIYADQTSETAQTIIDNIVSMYINEFTVCSMYANNFDDETVPPWEVVETMEDINAEMGYKYKYRLCTSDEQEWVFRIIMTEEEIKCLFE